MIYPIYVYGSHILRAECKDVQKGHPQLKELINDMFDTMAAANGVGLAAPQIGKPLNLFCVDLTEWDPEDKDMPISDTSILRRVFINPVIIERIGESIKFKEGCLSLPGINEDVMREERIRIQYLDENFEPQEQEFESIWARVIQHEYDHINGVLFADHLAPIRRSLIKSKLTKMSKGIHTAKYRCKNS